MENLSLVSSPKFVLGLSPSHKNSIFIANPFWVLPENSVPKNPSAFPLPFSCRGANSVLAKSKGEYFASFTSSNSQQTSSVGVNPPPVQPPPSQVGSPLFWIGVGVGLAALFSWVKMKVVERAESLKNYAMQQAFKAVMERMNTQNNQFANSGFSPNSPFAPASSTSTSLPPAASQATTVDVSATRVEEPPATDINDDSEYKEQPKKYAFVDVSPSETFQKSAFESYKESAEADSSNDPIVADHISPNGTAFKLEEGASQASSSSGKQILHCQWKLWRKCLKIQQCKRWFTPICLRR